MQEHDEELEVTQDELTVLKQRADILGITYHPSIGLQKLRAKVRQAMEDPDEASGGAEEDKGGLAIPSGETPGELRVRLRREASALRRVIVTCMNPNKTAYEGEIFSVANSMVGNFKKYVPFNNDAGWHIPNIIYLHLLERMCQIFVNKKNAKGVTVREAKLIKEFNVVLLPPLSPEELKELAHQQATAHNID